MEDDLTVCRCQEVTRGEIKEAIRKYDLRTVAEVKRCTRAGMGLCQSKTCGQLVIGILAQETGRRQAEIQPDTIRPPVRPVKIGTIGNLVEDHG